MPKPRPKTDEIRSWGSPIRQEQPAPKPVIIKPSLAEVMSKEGSGWTAKQLAQWGVPWPPPTGWIERLVNDG
jgi:hypothetical protein